MTESSEICICNEIVKKAISELESSNPRSTGNRTKARRRNPPSSKSNSFDDLLHRRFDPNMQSIYSVPVPTSGVATSSGHRISDSIDTMIVIQDEENCPPPKSPKYYLKDYIFALVKNLTSQTTLLGFIKKRLNYELYMVSLATATLKLRTSTIGSTVIMSDGTLKPSDLHCGVDDDDMSIETGGSFVEDNLFPAASSGAESDTMTKNSSVVSEEPKLYEIGNSDQSSTIVNNLNIQSNLEQLDLFQSDQERNYGQNDDINLSILSQAMGSNDENPSNLSNGNGENINPLTGKQFSKLKLRKEVDIETLGICENCAMIAYVPGHIHECVDENGYMTAKFHCVFKDCDKFYVSVHGLKNHEEKKHENYKSPLFELYEVKTQSDAEKYNSNVQIFHSNNPENINSLTGKPFSKLKPRKEVDIETLGICDNCAMIAYVPGHIHECVDENGKMVAKIRCGFKYCDKSYVSAYKLKEHEEKKHKNEKSPLFELYEVKTQSDAEEYNSKIQIAHSKRLG